MEKANKSAMATALAALFAVIVTANLTLVRSAQAAPQLDAKRLAGGFSAPLFVTAPPGDTSRLFVVQQSGQIKIVNLSSRTVNATPFLDISGEISFTGE